MIIEANQRGFVAFDWRGEVYSLSRRCDVKSKALNVRLGDANALPTVDQTQEELDPTLLQQMQRLHHRVEEAYAARFSTPQTRKEQLKQGHVQERTVLEEQQAKRAAKEQEERQPHFTRCLRELSSRVTGQHAQRGYSSKILLKVRTMRLSIEVTPEQHQRLRAVAALKGQTIKDYVLVPPADF